MSLFPSLDGFEPTRKTLHLYAQAVGVVPRVHAAAHDKWWHISLRVTPTGLKTAVFDLPTLGTNQQFLNLIQTREIQTLHTQEATLEDVFIQVTGRSLS